MRRARKPDARVIVALALIGVLGIGLFCAASARAETNINAIVCGPEVQPSITLTAPDPSISVTTPSVTIAGTIAQTNQVVIYVDGTYNQTLAVAVGQADFSAEVSISNGTHQLQAEAVNGSCSVKQAVVVTANLGGSTTPPETLAPGSEAENVTVSHPSGVIVQSDGGQLKQYDGTNNPIGGWASNGTPWVTPLDVFRGGMTPQAVSWAVQTIWIAVFVAATVLLTFGHVVTQFGILKVLQPHQRWLPYVAIGLMLLAIAASA